VAKGGPIHGATVADAVEVAWLAEAATESLRRHAPVTIAEVRNS
jgi:myo-inositol 2-dehydrogenase/D-chiro-inositol 1-dehydrogenase